MKPSWIDPTARDYPEDFADENGCYYHECRRCGKGFNGHKRRPNVCKVCALVEQKEWEALTPEEQHTRLLKIANLFGT